VQVLWDLLDSTIGARQSFALALLLFFLPILFFAYWAIKRGAQVKFRPIAAYEALRGLFARSVETGQPVHLSLGTSGVGDQFTADTVAALNVLEYLAERGAVSAAAPLVTLAHPTTLVAAQDLLRRVYRQSGLAEEYEPTRARLTAPDPLCFSTPRPDHFPYAVGTMRLLTQQKLVANVMVGRFGDEFLLMGEAGAQRGLTQIGGTSAPEVLPLVTATMTHPLIGEEIYAGGAYLSNKTTHLGSLLAQDLMRGVIVAAVTGMVLLLTLGLI